MSVLLSTLTSILQIVISFPALASSYIARISDSCTVTARELVQGEGWFCFRDVVVLLLWLLVRCTVNISLHYISGLIDPECATETESAQRRVKPFDQDARGEWTLYSELWQVTVGFALALRKERATRHY